MSTDMMGFAPTQINRNETMMQTQSDRAVAEVQAAYVIAKKFPRNQSEAYLAIMESCKRPFLAEQAMYAYPRGNQVVKGPSIRLAEVLAQNWGNMDAGIRELSQADGVSIAEAYAIDLQTNTRVTKIFHVPHIRYTKKGSQKLSDPRDIYELVANQGARRMRACILAVIPGDVVEAAVQQCEKTLLDGKEPIVDQVRKMVMAFDELGVKPSHIEGNLGHSMEAIIPQEIVKLKAIFKSLRDGMAKREDFFDMGNASSTNEHVNNLINNKAKENDNPVTNKEVNPTVETTAPVNADPMTPEQWNEIEALQAVKDISKEHLIKLHDLFKVSSFEELNKEQADKLISQLKKYADKQ